MLETAPASCSDCPWQQSLDPFQATIIASVRHCQPSWVLPPTADALLLPTVLLLPDGIGSASTPMLAVDRIQNLSYPLQNRQACAYLPSAAYQCEIHDCCKCARALSLCAPVFVCMRASSCERKRWWRAVEWGALHVFLRSGAWIPACCHLGRAGSKMAEVAAPSSPRAGSARLGRRRRSAFASCFAFRALLRRAAHIGQTPPQRPS